MNGSKNVRGEMFLVVNHYDTAITTAHSEDFFLKANTMHRAIFSKGSTAASWEDSIMS